MTDKKSKKDPREWVQSPLRDLAPLGKGAPCPGMVLNPNRSRQAALAQLVEHIIRNDGVTCSSHVSGTSFSAIFEAFTDVPDVPLYI